MDHTPGCVSLCVSYALCVSFPFSVSLCFFTFSVAAVIRRVWSHMEWKTVQWKNIKCAPSSLPVFHRTKCTWLRLFICLCVFSLWWGHQAIWMGSLHSDSAVTQYYWGRAGLSVSAGVYIIVCVSEQHDLLVQTKGFTLLQVCVLSLMRLICHRCFERVALCVCVCVCMCVWVCGRTYLRMVIYAIGLEQKRPFLISSRKGQEVLYSMCVRESVCVSGQRFLA